MLYCVPTMILGDRRMRWVFALPTALAAGLVWMEMLFPVLGRAVAWQLVAIVAVWLASIGIRALGAVIRRF